MSKPLHVNVTDAPYNAKGDGVRSDRLAIQAAINDVALAGGGCVYFPKGTYLIDEEPWPGEVGGLQLKQNVMLQGEAPRAAVLKLADFTNRSLIYGPGNVDTLWGSGSTAGVENWSLLNVELDGNRANNTHGNGVWIYGAKPVVQNLYIHNIAENAWRTEWGDAGPLLGMEGTITNVRIDTCGKHGFWFSGPHDSVINTVFVTDASQASHNTYDSFRLDGSVYSRFFALHCWNRSIVTNRARYGLHDSSVGNDFIGCQFEGAYSANAFLSGRESTFEACRFFAAANGVNVMIRGTEYVVRGSLDGPLAGAPDCKGVVLGQPGDWISSNVIDVYARFQAAGVVDFTHSSGGNSVRARGYQPTGILYVGTPKPNDDVDLMLTDSAGGIFRQTPR